MITFLDCSEYQNEFIHVRGAEVHKHVLMTSIEFYQLWSLNKQQ